MTATSYTRVQALADLQAVYDQLPAVHCKGRCADACTVAPASELERHLVAEVGRPLRPHMPHRVHLQLINAGVHQRCPNLGPVNNCLVYERRPLICRSFGSWRTSACEHGCLADRMVEQDEVFAWAKRIEEISARWEAAGRP